MGKKTEKRGNFETKLKGSDGFELYYSNLFSSRWKTLKESLKDENVYAEWNAGGKEKYYLDPASVFAAACLPLENAENILDMCAAPGGKTLVLGSLMNENAILTSNERSFVRKKRLLNVCSSCLPENVFNRVKITLSDGAKLCTKMSECFDSILLDAPCSSERHVLNDEKYLSEWSPSRIKSLAMEQWALLSSAFRLLKKGGYILYSTCALNKTENDEVIRRLLKKFPNANLVYKEKEPLINENYKKFTKTEISIVPERTEFGFHILPDVQNGKGPIWFTLIEKM